MAEHRNLTGASLHETIGADAASANTVHMAVGDGSTEWGFIDSSNLDSTSIFNTNKFKITTQLSDISTADFVLVPISNSCTLVKATTVLHAAISGSDSLLTFTNSNGPAVTGTITVANSGSAEGDVDTLVPTTNNSFTNGTYLKIATDGASSGTAKLTILLDFTYTGS